MDADQPSEAVPSLTLAAERAKRAGRAAEAGRFLLKVSRIEEQLGQFDAAFETKSSAAELLALAVPLEEFEPGFVLQREQPAQQARETWPE